MRVDIILITYNQEQYICQAVEGIRIQQVSPDVSLRILVADDKSTDGTKETLHRYLDGDFQLASGHKPEVVFMPLAENLGHVKNYQRVFTQCKSDYVAIIEGDDYWNTSDHIQSRLDFMTTHTDCVLVSRYPIWYYEDDNRYDYRFKEVCEGREFVYYSMEEEILANRIVNLSSCLLKGDAIRKLDKRVFECTVLDWPMYVNMLQMGTFAILPGATNVYRIKSSGLYAGINEEQQILMDIRLIHEMESIFPQYEPYFEKALSSLQSPTESQPSQKAIAPMRWLRKGWKYITKICKKC